MKKKGFDLEKTVLLLGRISRNRLILAVLLVVDGIVFLANPEQPVEEMGRTIAITMAFAAAAIIIPKIVAKERFVRFIPAFLLLAAGGLMFFYPDVLSAYFRLLLALVIIINGSINLLNVLGLSREQEIVVSFRDKITRLFSRIKSPKDLEEGIDEQASKYFRPLQKIISETEGHKIFYLATNVLAVILGALLLIKPDLSITVFGLIFIYVGISDFVMVYRTRKISEKLRDKKYREILLEDSEER
jgi:uncharacterized membrane protein HdeD (DUF308 family)